MKKISYLLLFLAFSANVSGQIDGNYLLQLINVSTADLPNITSPATGALVYNRTEGAVFQYNGSNWEKVDTTNALPLVFAKTAGYTLTADDNGNILTFNSSTDVKLEIPAGLPIGFNVSVYQLGDGKVYFVGDFVTIKNRLSRFYTAGKDAGAGLVATGRDIFHLTGDLKK